MANMAQDDEARGEPRKRGRQPNAWIDGFGPASFVDYRREHGLSEAKLARYVGVTLTTLRNWIQDKNRPAPEKQEQYRDLLARPYEAPPDAPSAPRGRPPRFDARDDDDDDFEAPRRPEPRPAPAHPARDDHDDRDDRDPPPSTSAVAEVVAAYVRRLPPERLLSIDELVADIERIKRALSE